MITAFISYLIILLWVIVFKFNASWIEEVRIYELEKTYLVRIGLKWIPFYTVINQFKEGNYFDLDHFDWKTGNNPEINRWFNFMLNTTEEEINFLQEELVNRKDALENIHDLNQDNSPFTDEIKKMKMKVLAPKQY